MSDILSELNAAVNGAEIKKADHDEFHKLIVKLSKPVLAKYGLDGAIYTWGVSMHSVGCLYIHEKCAQHLFSYNREFVKDKRCGEFGAKGRFCNFVWTLGSVDAYATYGEKTVGEYIDFQVSLSWNRKLIDAQEHLANLSEQVMKQKVYCAELESEVAKYKHVYISLGIE